jgi:hypothetical protein
MPPFAAAHQSVPGVQIKMTYEKCLIKMSFKNFRGALSRRAS